MNAEAAAEAASLPALAALAAAAPLRRDVLDCAARSGSVAVLEWLYERGCGCGGATFECAAGSGCEEALEWLVERGCLVPTDGSPYIVACLHRDAATLAALRRLGCPWGPPGRVLRWAAAYGCEPRLLRWLLRRGCPAGLEHPGGQRAGRGGGRSGEAQLRALLAEAEAQRGEHELWL
ncbi:hypothetical protein GPECTOR_1082g359 [Gonium pectorale]|uniref:Ankyrin repeat domain-containing protein n=1 Tax=Gonium pectorale TaxID=33097 RepID=A0A150FTN3_GONPE|nr:hypothetical protein GPECTOR_1082g359 [Gonium pectorale]|eukprot:KXZ40972.1 hypothetical protein GPECTOR_1082g359 [Gonium pectorale]